MESDKLPGFSWRTLTDAELITAGGTMTDTQALVEATETEAAQELYDSLKPTAEMEGRKYIEARMPPAQMALMKDQLDADFPLPAEPAPTTP